MSDVIIKNNIPQVKQMIQQQCLKALEECGMLGEKYAKKNITEQDAVDTGNLRNSITHMVDESSLECHIGTDVKYAPYVEFGTGIYVAGGRQTPWVFTDSKGETHMTRGMRPRPYLKPAVANHVGDYEKVFKNNLSQIK